MAKKRKADKSFDMKAHMAKIRGMRGKGKRKGGKGSRMKKLNAEVKGLRKEIGGMSKLIARMAKQSGAIKPKSRKRATTRRRR